MIFSIVKFYKFGSFCSGLMNPNIIISSKVIISEEKIPSSNPRYVIWKAFQAIQRTREHIIRERTTLSNHLRGIIAEFGVVITKDPSHLRRNIPEILEDTHNEIPGLYRPTLACMFDLFIRLEEDIKVLTKQIEELVKHTPECKKLTKQ